MNRTLFIGIGPPKTGTSWLYGYLLRHPEVFMSPIKELEYFSARYRPDRSSHWDQTYRKRAAEMQAKYDAEPTPQRAHLLTALNARVAMIDDPSAYLRYFESAAAPEHKVFGEISPSYFAVLRQNGFRAIRRVSAKRRILCTLRDPVDRLWSEVRFRKRRYDDDSFDPLAEFEKALKTRELAGRSQQGSQLDMVESIFGAEEFRVEFYETLFTEHTMRGICEWLGVEFVDPDFDHTANSSEEIPLPAELRARARIHFAPTYERYKERFGDRLPESWEAWW